MREAIPEQGGPVVVGFPRAISIGIAEGSVGACKDVEDAFPADPQVGSRGPLRVATYIAE